MVPKASFKGGERLPIFRTLPGFRSSNRKAAQKLEQHRVDLGRPLLLKPVAGTLHHPEMTFFCKSFFWSGERQFLGSLTRFACGDALLKLSSTISPRQLNFAKIGSMGRGAADGIKNGGIDC